MSAEATSSLMQPSDGESSTLTPSPDLPEIKFAFTIKWFLFKHEVHENFKMPHTRFYQIPGFPGFKYNLSIRRSHPDFDSEEDSDNDELNFDILRVTLLPTNSTFKSYKVLAEWTEHKHSSADEKCSQNLNDHIRFFDKKQSLYFPDADNMPGFISIEGTFNIKQIYSKDIKIEDIPAEHRALRNDEKGKDYILVAGKKDIKVHKSVLMHHSPVFAAAFSDNEWKEGAERKYAIPDFSHKIVEIAVGVIYGQAYSGNLTKEEYISLFHFANKYQMEGLKEAVADGVILTPHNICDYLNLCHSTKCEDLFDYFLTYLLIFVQNGYVIHDTSSLIPEVKSLYADRSMAEPLKYVKSPVNNYYSFRDETEGYEAETEIETMNLLVSDYK